VKILSQTYPWTEKYPLNFGSQPHSETGSGSEPRYGPRVQTRIALVEVCALKVPLCIFCMFLYFCTQQTSYFINY